MLNLDDNLIRALIPSDSIRSSTVTISQGAYVHDGIDIHRNKRREQGTPSRLHIQCEHIALDDPLRPCQRRGLIQHREDRPLYGRAPSDCGTILIR